MSERGERDEEDSGDFPFLVMIAMYSVAFLVWVLLGSPGWYLYVLLAIAAGTLFFVWRTRPRPDPTAPEPVPDE